MTDTWCGFSAPFLGRCVCGDRTNHQPGGIYFREGRVPADVITATANTINGDQND